MTARTQGLNIDYRHLMATYGMYAATLSIAVANFNMAVLIKNNVCIKLSSWETGNTSADNKDVVQSIIDAVLLILQTATTEATIGPKNTGLIIHAVCSFLMEEFGVKPSGSLSKLGFSIQILYPDEVVQYGARDNVHR